jgi:AcrR family transcriptional regulator
MPVVATREDYFEAALVILANSGSQQLKIGSLCRAVGVTTGSFYGYFQGWKGFVAQFLEYWEQAQTITIVQTSSTHEDPYQRLAVMQQLAAEIPHAAEAALRAWGHTDPTVRDAMQRVDELRYQSLRDIVELVVSNPDDADFVASLGITLLVGLQQWRSPVALEEFGRYAVEFERTVRAHADSAAPAKARRSKKAVKSA